ncbi:MAG: tetratricopeptide repeat protein [Flammeovirgaceae bacterium]
MDQKKLNNLFHILKTSEEEEEIQKTIEKVWQVWMISGEADLDFLMEKGCKAMSDGNFSDAITDFSMIIDKNPNYAEGWNKRATAFYLRGDYKKSIDDIKVTLELEPRHFGALSGWATICLIIGDELGAFHAFRKLESIYPNRKGLKKKINTLSKKLGLDGDRYN